MSTPTRTMRIPDELWNEAGMAATANGDNVTNVVRTALEQYVVDTAHQAPRVAALTQQLHRQYPAEPMVELVRIIRAGLDTLTAAEDGDVLAYARGWLEARQ